MGSIYDPGPKKSPSAEDQLTAPPVHPSLLHKRLYERNGEVQANLHTFFQVRQHTLKKTSKP